MYITSQTLSDPCFSSEDIKKKTTKNQTNKNNNAFVFQDPEEFLATLFLTLLLKRMERITRYVSIRGKSELENILDRRFILLGIASIQSVRRSFHPVLKNLFYRTKTKLLPLPCGKYQQLEQLCFRLSQKESG